nr:MAG TPA: hypothetical protein [Caudoviricetes sp.]
MAAAFLIAFSRRGKIGVCIQFYTIYCVILYMHHNILWKKPPDGVTRCKLKANLFS